MKDKGKILDEQITTFLTNKDTRSIQELLGLEFNGSVLDEKGMISVDFLRAVMIKRDEIVYRLKGIKREDGLSYAEVESELELLPEESTYNYTMEDSEDITVVHATGKGGQPMIFYYYWSDSNYYYGYKHSNNTMTREMRTQSRDGKFLRIERALALVSNQHWKYSEGKYHASMGYLDGSLLVTMKDKYGNKQAALYQDDITGCKYFEYDKNGNRTLSVSEEAVGHDVIIDGQTYSVYDGFFEPCGNGYTLKRFNDGETIQDINPSDIERSVSVADPDLRKKVINSLDARTKEEILGILQALAPIFQAMYDNRDIEDMHTTKMEKLVTWLGNFSKRLKIDPKLATQDSAVMSAMKSAVHKTIGRTADAQMDLNTPRKEEKLYEGEEYGDN